MKLGDVYLNADFNKCELFAYNLENAFTLNSSLDNSKNNLVQHNIGESDKVSQNIISYKSL